MFSQEASTLKPFHSVLSFLSPVLLSLALAACGTSTLGGGDGGGGGGSGACEGPNPAATHCDSDAQCGAGEVCSPDACVPSSCWCDEYGEWFCYQDCTKGCLPAPPCPDPPPDEKACDKSSQCAPDETCDLDACVPSGCECDPDAGWLCTLDCRGGCVSAQSVCNAPDPSAGGCEFDSDCPFGLLCFTGGCHPSECHCDAGAWICTDDCAQGAFCADPG